MKRTLAVVAMGVGLAWPAAAAAQTTPTPDPGEYTEVLPVQITPEVRGTTPEVRGTQTARPLPRTGQDSLELVLVGGGLAVGGAVLVVGARRRRHAVVRATA
ncbi:MAG: LPXTG cell wall anchor domain-containing protein [Acidimicrobiia bacterium]|nr:LPXTG cell wall anchor domain-containing protein [Acidimicrobiia bacterium]